MTASTHATVHEIEVPLSRNRAFQLFTEHFAAWWPKEYTWSQSALKHIGIEPRMDGRCTEEGPHGFQVDWGRVLAWEPPGRVTVTWQIGPGRVPQPDPANASRVDLRFIAKGRDATRLVLEHGDFHHHGEGAEAYCKTMASEYGWPFILERYREMALRLDAF